MRTLADTEGTLFGAPPYANEARTYANEHVPIYNLFPVQIRHPAPNQSEAQNASPYRDQTILSPYTRCREAGTGNIGGPGVGEIGPTVKSEAW